MTASAPSLGVFWLLIANSGETRWLAHICPAALVEPYGDCLTCPHGHYELWEAWREGTTSPATEAVVGLTPDVLCGVGSSEYDDWPRGRVVREPERTVVYADAQLLTPECRTRLIELFGLDPERTTFERDAHYSRSRRVR